MAARRRRSGGQRGRAARDWGIEPLEPRQVLAAAPFVGVRLVASGNEARLSDTVFELTRSGPTTAPLVVNAVLAGTATANVDFTAPATLQASRRFTATIPAGQATVQVALPTRADAVYDPTETIEFIVQRGAGYSIQPAGDRAAAIIAAEGVFGAVGDERSLPTFGDHRQNWEAFAAVRSDGSVVTWGTPESGGAASGIDFDGPGNDLAVVEIVSTPKAFAAVRSDGSVVTWGDPLEGGNSSGIDFNGPADNLTVVRVVASAEAFAALRSDGSVVTWGKGVTNSVDFDGPDNSLAVTRIVSNAFAFAALRSDGSVVTWGSASYGGNSSTVPFKGPNGNLSVTAIVPGHGFAAIRSDGSVVTWGDFGGDSSQVDFNGPRNDLAVVSIVSNSSSYAALRSDGSVVAWGHSFYGGDASAVDFDGPGNNLTVVRVFPLDGGYAALRSDGSVVHWGYLDQLHRGESRVDISSVDFDGPNNDLTVTRIIQNTFASAALLSDGSVVTWGRTTAVADPVRFDFSGPNNSVRDIVASNFDFAALRSDGSVVAWGHTDGGASFPYTLPDFDGPSDSLDVTRIVSNGRSFAALRTDGSVVTWPGNEPGGNSAGVDFDGPNGTLKVAAIATPDIVVSATRNVAPAGIFISASTVEEGLPIGTVVGTLTTLDANPGDTFTYSLVSGDTNVFTIVGDQLRTARVLSYGGRRTFSVRVRSTDAGGLFTEKTLTVSVTRSPFGPMVAVAAEAQAGSPPVVRLVEAANGVVRAEGTVFEPTFRGGVRVAMGDVTGDGVAEVIAAPGRGRVGEIRVFRRFGPELRELASHRIQPFGPNYTGGIELASGDVDGDGFDDVIAAMASGSGAVKVFLGAMMAADPIDGPAAITIQPTVPRNYRGGASVAVADVGTFANGSLVSGIMPDNKMEIVVGSGVGMTPRVLVYDVSNRASPRVADTIAPGAYKNQAGISVTSMRANADIIDDIVVSAGRGGRSFTQIYDGTVSPQDNARLTFFSALGGTARPNAPLFTAAVDTNGDGVADRFLQSQGDVGGTSGISNVSLTGVRQGAVSSLAGPLRIAAERIGFTTQVTSSGLSYFDVTVGSGAVPTPSSQLTVHYTGRYPNGEVFDTSRDGPNTPAVFTLGGVIPGFGQGLSTMRAGGRRILFIPSRIAYDGEPGKPAGDLIFEVELLAVG